MIIGDNPTIVSYHASLYIERHDDTSKETIDGQLRLLNGVTCAV
jgi:ABC-type microcin C transport system permease subunit YejE